ncbi:DUF6197 family protein [Streptomyces microflavus]|uniref:DUF6197 family protein n=1 Tax=Streptomyces microflavus TaxID=1919 RepID=UPI0036B4C50D
MNIDAYLDREQFEAAARERLAAAAEHLATHGWHQGDMYDARDLHYDGTPQNGTGARWTKTARSCALGAIQASGERDYLLETGATNLLRKHLGLSAIPVLDSAGYQMTYKDPVAAWNDDPSRTAEDVILAMKRAAVES